MILTDKEAIDIVKELSSVRPKWVITARENSRVYKALVNGDNFSQVLIDKIEHIESSEKKSARYKYSKDIRDVFDRVMKPRDNVFQANGGSEIIATTNDVIKSKFIYLQSNFKSNKSVFKYLAENYFNLSDIDPNGVIFLEYTSGDKMNVYPTYKSIDDIAGYLANGQKMEYLVFEPTLKVYTSGDINVPMSSKLWRIVDDVNDRTIMEFHGMYTIIKAKSFVHPFGEVPGLILSEREKIGSEVRVPSIDKILELSKDYARDKSILTIYKFQKGYPIHWRFVTQCKSCLGMGKTGADATNCRTCDGYGYVRNSDVTDIVTLPLPELDQPNIAPNIAGFISPDLDTWTQYKEDIKDLEKIMKDTIWGTNLYSSTNSKLQETETATGRYIDVQPIMNTLNVYSDVVEYIDNTLCNWLLNFLDPVKDKNEVLYTKTYGRRFIIESPDVILEKYQSAKENSDSSLVLDKLLEEFILSKFKNDNYMQNVMLKKKNLEPYVHMSLLDINTVFGPEEAYKKELFNKFWVAVDQNLPQEKLKADFEAYLAANKKIFNNEQIKEDESL